MALLIYRQMPGKNSGILCRMCVWFATPVGRGRFLIFRNVEAEERVRLARRRTRLDLPEIALVRLKLFGTPSFEGSYFLSAGNCKLKQKNNAEIRVTIDY